jgi:RNA polymerase sigma factor (sigma-70 family)
VISTYVMDRTIRVVSPAQRLFAENLGESVESLPGTRWADLDDAELLRHVARRRPDAFRALYERHRDAVAAYVRDRTSDPAAVDGLVAETFVRTLRRVRAGDGPQDAFLPFVRNVADDLVETHPSEEERSEEEWFDEQRFDERRDVPPPDLGRAVRRLSDRWRRVLWLAEVEGCSPDEMAASLGVDAATAIALTRRARAGLRQAYLLTCLRPETPAACRRTLDRLPAHARAALQPAVAGPVEEHLAGCASCRARSAEYDGLAVDPREPLVPVLLGGGLLGPAVLDLPAGVPASAWRPSVGKPVGTHVARLVGTHVARLGDSRVGSRISGHVRRHLGRPVGLVAAGVAIAMVVVLAGASWIPDRRPERGSAPPAAAGGATAPVGPSATPPSAGPMTTLPRAEAEASRPRTAVVSRRPEQRAPVSAGRKSAVPPGGRTPPAVAPSSGPTPAPSAQPRKVCVGVLVVRLCRAVG